MRDFTDLPAGQQQKPTVHGYHKGAGGDNWAAGRRRDSRVHHQRGTHAKRVTRTGIGMSSHDGAIVGGPGRAPPGLGHSTVSRVQILGCGALDACTQSATPLNMMHRISMFEKVQKKKNQLTTRKAMTTRTKAAADRICIADVGGRAGVTIVAGGALGQRGRCGAQPVQATGG